MPWAQLGQENWRLDASFGACASTQPCELCLLLLRAPRQHFRLATRCTRSGRCAGSAAQGPLQLASGMVSPGACLGRYTSTCCHLKRGALERFSGRTQNKAPSFAWLPFPHTLKPRPFPTFLPRTCAERRPPYHLGAVHKQWSPEVLQVLYRNVLPVHQAQRVQHGKAGATRDRHALSLHGCMQLVNPPRNVAGIGFDLAGLIHACRGGHAKRLPRPLPPISGVVQLPETAPLLVAQGMLQKL